jgi:hypothetical protein
MRTLSLTRSVRHVLGADLNRSESKCQRKSCNDAIENWPVRRTVSSSTRASGSGFSSKTLTKAPALSGLFIRLITKVAEIIGTMPYSMSALLRKRHRRPFCHTGLGRLLSGTTRAPWRRMMTLPGHPQPLEGCPSQVSKHVGK